MKKLLTAVSFAAGGLFALMFSSKKGDELRKQVKSEKTPEGKIEVVGKEAKNVFVNFWRLIKDPLQKGLQKAEHEAEKYGHEAKKKLGSWKNTVTNKVKKVGKKLKP